ncbi:MAG: hypothetical protein HY828_16450 [Actinobacteria bacterium]|nr:hypothetical protein [Actinomycetota bacterium]
MHALPGLWPSPWPAEDGGAERRQVPLVPSGLALRIGDTLEVTSRLSIASTMVILRDPGEVYLLCHTGGDGAISWVEQLDPVTLEPVRRSADLPGGPTWPGGIAAHANGSLYVVFGRHAHRLSADLSEVLTVELPRDRPYNSFVVLPDGCLATKDFAGARPGHLDGDDLGGSELLVLEPDSLAVVGRCALPEPSIARLSASGSDVYVVGDTSLFRVRWDGRQLLLDASFGPRYRTMDGQTYGWDAVITDDAAWFLDNGAGNERYAGSFRGLGVSTAPLHLVRVGLGDGSVSMAEVCGLPGGLIANPPAVDTERHIAVGYDSGNGVVSAFRFGDDGVLTPLWQRAMNHAAHPLLLADTGELVLCDHDAARNAEQVVVLRIETGEELARADTGSPVQSVLFGAPGFDRDLYLCSFTTVSRVTVSG